MNFWIVGSGRFGSGERGAQLRFPSVTGGDVVKAGFISLGCAKNLVDTEVMLGLLQKNGIELTPEPGEADILVVNTCAFIESAKEESITTILNMAEYKSEPPHRGYSDGSGTSGGGRREGNQSRRAGYDELWA